MLHILWPYIKTVSILMIMYLPHLLPLRKDKLTILYIVYWILWLQMLSTELNLNPEPEILNICCFRYITLIIWCITTNSKENRNLELLEVIEQSLRLSHFFTSSTAKKWNTAWQRVQNTAATGTRSVFFISINFLRGLCESFKPCLTYFSSQLDWIRSPKEGIWNIDVELSAMRFSCVYRTAERP